MSSEPTIKKLLIVDDSKVSRMVIKARVKAIHPDWEILEANNGTEGIAVAEQHKPDFCTMDINMPGILGTEAAEHILKSVPSIRMVIFSANIQETFQDKANAMGAVFVAKPVTEKSIAEALRYFLG
ncbi:response regulator [Undibacterium fentianense]|uniref:Response regulator n=1 Tax=Undibacterium fentianense TaxID=2828728 RepID=A0A941E104_9BURK|nr:response regulator [Undibacterium fentianense]MBR7801234.1 response regulator [Undibacterium fentianense]